jgi:hypothetical protein
MANIDNNTDLEQFFKDLGYEIDWTDKDAVLGAMQALHDVVIARGDENLLGLSSLPKLPGFNNGTGMPEQDDARLKRPKVKSNAAPDDEPVEPGDGEEADPADLEPLPGQTKSKSDKAKDFKAYKKSRLKDLIEDVTDDINAHPDKYNTKEAEEDRQKLEDLQQKLEDPDLTDADYDTIEAEIVGIASKYAQLQQQSETDRNARIKKFRDDINSKTTQQELEDEDNDFLQKEYKQQKANKPIAQNSFPGFDTFRQDFFRAIHAQVVMSEKNQDTWSKLPRRSPEGVLKKGQQGLPYVKTVPTIDVFVDQSGSWTQSELEVSRKAIEGIQTFVNKGKLHLNVYYFNDNVSKTLSGVRGSYTMAWGNIMHTINDNGARNVLIITDGDMNTRGDHSLRIQVPGHVWFLWRRNEDGLSFAPRLPMELTGAQGTDQYEFSV